jgi:hypothetical protein
MDVPHSNRNTVEKVQPERGEGSKEEGALWEREGRDSFSSCSSGTPGDAFAAGVAPPKRGEKSGGVEGAESRAAAVLRSLPTGTGAKPAAAREGMGSACEEETMRCVLSCVRRSTLCCATDGMRSGRQQRRNGSGSGSGKGGEREGEGGLPHTHTRTPDSMSAVRLHCPPRS